MFSKKLGLAVIILVILAFLVWFGGPFYLKFLSSRYHPEPGETPLKINGSTTNALPESSYNGPVVNYKNGQFSPPTVQLKVSASGMGCLLKVQNQDQNPLTIRLGPYTMSLKDNYGQKYDPIPPGKYLIFDPRFGMTKEEFLNLNRPEEKFEVEVDSSCLPN